VLEASGGEGQDESIEPKIKTRNGTKAFLDRVAIGCNLDHVEVARVYSKYA